VVNADAAVHELLTPDTDLGQQVIRILGSDIVAEGKINRRTIAEKVFKDPKLLEKLERLIHPAVLKKIEEGYAEAAKRGKFTAFIVEIPLLFEIGQEKFYDVIVTVLADEALSRKRFEQAGFQPEEYERRMRRQLQPAQKAQRAHYTLVNNGSLEDLRKQVIALHQTIQKS
jgi:dephospho-CoA kinase